MVVYDRWFITPAVEVDGILEPKYADTDGIVGFSGNTFDPSVIENAGYYGLIATYPDVKKWYVVRMYGEDIAGWNAINNIHVLGDTRTLADHKKDVAPIMRSRFGQNNWKFEVGF